MDSVIFYLGCLFRGTVAILVHENLSEFELSEYIEKFEPGICFVNGLQMTGKRRWKHFLTVKLPANMGVMK